MFDFSVFQEILLLGYFLWFTDGDIPSGGFFVEEGYLCGDGDYFADPEGATDDSDTDSILLRILALALSWFEIAESLCSNDLSLTFRIANWEKKILYYFCPEQYSRK